jgi:hypothetical protein
VRITAQDFAVFAGAGLAFIGVDNEIAWTVEWGYEWKVGRCVKTMGLGKPP